MVVDEVWVKAVEGADVESWRALVETMEAKASKVVEMQCTARRRHHYRSASAVSPR